MRAEPDLHFDGDTMLYVYGFIDRAAQHQAHAALEHDAAVEFVSVGGIAAVASEVANDNFEPPAGDAEAQLAWVTPRAWRHHQVVQRLHTCTAVVPVNFGTLCQDVEHLRDVACGLREPIVAMLARFSGKDEWTITLRLSRRLLEERLRGTDAELLALQRDIDLLPAGRAYLVRKKLETVTKREVAGFEARLTSAVADTLSDLGIDHVDAVATPLAREEDRQGIASIAALVPRAAFDAVEQRLADVEQQHADCLLTCELVGPWPAYSFACELTLDVDATSAAKMYS